ncbi:hypothetical protein TNIN_479441 [Trichonephila inaurata madagascariensis]|uniref:Uncharacterized protein n=1 Tax=Trichonephila inaurata madagascariensis TaxID=2747483 RepID=A0A8X6MJ91_9ARAC|nr:hypothetical protein TNIN_479441 [Trichonephila inaurata madagascariensis]
MLKSTNQDVKRVVHDQILFEAPLYQLQHTGQAPLPRIVSGLCLIYCPVVRSSTGGIFSIAYQFWKRLRCRRYLPNSRNNVRGNGQLKMLIRFPIIAPRLLSLLPLTFTDTSSGCSYVELGKTASFYEIQFFTSSLPTIVSVCRSQSAGRSYVNESENNPEVG